MVSSLSCKMLLAVALSLMMFTQIAYAQFDDIEDDYQIPDCPNELMVFYKDCRGSLDQCSSCLGSAERKCREEQKKKGQYDGICYYCTTHANGNCNNIKPMCFGNQECDKDHKCIDRTCVYQPS